MNKYIKFFQIKMYIISSLTRYDIDHAESKYSGLMEDSSCFTVRILHGKPLSRKRYFRFNIGAVRLSPCLKHSALAKKKTRSTTVENRHSRLHPKKFLSPQLVCVSCAPFD